jgi:hypothetical protein
MFPEKERHWITGKYENKINYDSWNQWIETMLYKSWSYKPFMWNIEDADVTNGLYNLQILYAPRSGEFKIICILISISRWNEDEIRRWLKEQNLLVV